MPCKGIEGLSLRAQPHRGLSEEKESGFSSVLGGRGGAQNQRQAQLTAVWLWKPPCWSLGYAPAAALQCTSLPGKSATMETAICGPSGKMGNFAEPRSVLGSHHLRSCVHVSVCAMCVVWLHIWHQCKWLQKPEEGVRSSRTRVIGSC